MVSYQNQQDLQNKGAWVGDGGLALHLVLQLATCLLQRAAFEAYASLKWMPQQSKSKSGACITKTKRNHLTGLTLRGRAYVHSRKSTGHST